MKFSKKNWKKNFFWRLFFELPHTLFKVQSDMIYLKTNFK